MPILTPAGDAYTLTSLTDAILESPYIPQGVSQMPWNAEGLFTRTALVDRRHDGVDLVDERPYGSPGMPVVIEDAQPIALYVPHYPQTLTIRPEEVRARREFGQENVLETTESRMLRMTSRWRRNLDYTNEFLRVGALFGMIRNRVGTVVKNLTAVFEKKPRVYAFPFADANKQFIPFLTKVKQKALEDLGDFAVSGWLLYAATDMHQKVYTHKSVQDAYRFWDAAPMLRADGTKTPFTMSSDVQLQHYRNSVIPRSDGQTVFPKDAMVMTANADGLLQTRYAPRDDMRAINEVGLPMYASPEDLPHGRGVEIEGEINVLNYVRRYDAVIIIIDAGDAAAVAKYTALYGEITTINV